MTIVYAGQPRVDLLSPQEERVARARGMGASITETAYLLQVSDQTVKNHISSILRKLDATSFNEALYKLGWITIPDEPHAEPSQCEWTGRCGRVEGHRGHHGGFRRVLAHGDSSGVESRRLDQTMLET